MADKRLTHKEVVKRMHTDELGVAVSKSQEFFQKYGQMVLSIVGVVVIVSVGIWFFKKNQENKIMEANRLFVQAERDLSQGNYGTANQTLNNLSNKYPGTDLDVLAILLKADSAYASGDYETALTEYDKFLKKSPALLKEAASISKGYTLESLGRTDEALTLYEGLENDPGLKRPDEILYAKARCLETLGKADEAVETYKKISKGTNWELLGKDRIQWLEG